MKVTRAFWTEQETMTEVYEWRVDIEGELLCWREAIPIRDMYGGRSMPLMELERLAQWGLMRAIQKKLFGDRAL